MRPPTAVDHADTKTSLLDAGERLFAELGIAGASMRAITQEAAANLAAVHYHFGSKEGLVRAVFSRRLGPLNRERVERLASARRGRPRPRRSRASSRPSWPRRYR